MQYFPSDRQEPITFWRSVLSQEIGKLKTQPET